MSVTPKLVASRRWVSSRAPGRSVPSRIRARSAWAIWWYRGRRPLTRPFPFIPNPLGVLEHRRAARVAGAPTQEAAKGNADRDLGAAATVYSRTWRLAFARATTYLTNPLGGD